MKRAVVWVCIGLLLLFVVGTTVLQVLSSSGAFHGDDAPERSEAPADAWVQPELNPAARVAPEVELQIFYEQVPDWEPCANRHCARIEVPLDYADPGGTTIELALLRVDALKPSARIGALVVNPGGPGAPGTTFADQAPLAFNRALLERYDVVGFDPRGTGESDPIDCVSDARLSELLAGDPTPDTDADIRAAVNRGKQFAKGCRKHSGLLAKHVSTVEAARDMDIVRAVLEEEKLSYFGASYGTKLGATYAGLFPAQSGRLVLDGGIDPGLDFEELALGQARGFETALTSYVDACVATANCYLGATRADASATITGFLDQVEEEPMQVGDRTLEVGNAFYGIVLPLYNRSYWMLLDQALGDALEGDAAALLQLADLYASRSGDTYANNSSEAIRVINCLDDPAYLPVSEIPSRMAKFKQASPTFGDVFAWGLNGCEALSGLVGSTPPGPEDPSAAGADPMLVIGTTRDPATPYEWSVGLAEALAPAVLVSRDGDGHTGYNQGSECVDAAVEAYLLEGTVPAGPVTCT